MAVTDHASEIQHHPAVAADAIAVQFMVMGVLSRHGDVNRLSADEAQFAIGDGGTNVTCTAAGVLLCGLAPSGSQAAPLIRGMRLSRRRQGADIQDQLPDVGFAQLLVVRTHCGRSRSPAGALYALCALPGDQVKVSGTVLDNPVHLSVGNGGHGLGAGEIPRWRDEG